MLFYDLIQLTKKIYGFKKVLIEYINLVSWFFLKNKSFLIPNLLNDQSDFLHFLWSHGFVQYKLDSRRFSKMVDETPDLCIVSIEII